MTKQLERMPVNPQPHADAAAVDAPPSASPGGKLKRRTTVDLVLDELRSRILCGALAPSSPLRQEALAEELGVSRIPVREAIRILSAEGLVDVQPHKGAYVTTISKVEVQEFFDLRQRLEPWLLHEAVPKITDGDLLRAERIVAAMDSANAEHWGSLNWQLHELLYAAADRPAALGIVRALHEKSERYFRFQVVNAPIREQAHQEHLQLIALCRHRQADQAQALLEQHIGDAAEQILAIVDRMLEKAPSR